MKAISGVLIILIFLLPRIVYPQEENPYILERFTEKLSETSDNPVDFSELTEVLEHLRNHPINLNNTNVQELSQLFFLDDRQVNNLLNFIQTYGTIYSIYELRAVNGFDSSTIIKILPYVSIGAETEKHPINQKDLWILGKNQLLIRAGQVVQKQAGYSVTDSVLKKNPNAGYAGSPLKLYFRYSYSYYDRLFIGISGQKDAGEAFFRGCEKEGMDFYSGYISLQNTGMVEQLTIGNFKADFGQGLTLSSGISSGAIPRIGNDRRFARGIVPSQSTNEGNYLRGIALMLKKWNFRLSLLYSDHKRDGNVTSVDTTSGNVDLVSSFTETGYHRIPREIKDKNALNESIYGGNINFSNSFFSIGVTGFRSHWNASLEPKIYHYNLFSFRGKDNLNIGIDFQASYRNGFLFGECSRSLNGGMAFLSSIQLTPDPRLIFSLSIRDYQRNYQDLLSNALGQNTINVNEEGVQFTFSAGAARGLNLSGFADVYRFPWLKYRTDSPSHGTEYQLQADYTGVKLVMMSLRFTIKSKQISTKEATIPVNVLEDSQSTTLRYQAEWQISNFFKLKSTFEWLQNKSERLSPAYGYLLGQNLSYKIPGKHLAMVVLYNLFDTDSYNERIYSYENDVQYSYSIPSYYGKGIRFMGMLEWEAFSKVDIAIRYSETWYSDREVIGSGLDLIKGRTKSEAELQVRLKF